MKMNDTVARIVEIMFQDVEMNEEVSAIRDEVMNNCQDRYTDLVTSGMTEDEAIAAVVESLKGMDDVLAPYKRRKEPQEGKKLDYYIFSADEVKKIDVTLVSEDVTVEPSGDEMYHVKWDAEEMPLVRCDVQNGVLKIDRREDEVFVSRDKRERVQVETGNGDMHFDNLDGAIDSLTSAVDSTLKSVGATLRSIFGGKGDGMRIKFNFSSDGVVTVQVPENALPAVKLLTTSGDLSISDVALADLSIVATSGDVDDDMPEDPRLHRAAIRPPSAPVEATVFADEVNVRTISGDSELEGCISKLYVGSTSGDIDVRADVAVMGFKSISGDVDMEFDSDELREISGSTISGDIEIDLPSGLGSYAVNTRSRSGDVHTHISTDGRGPTVTGSVTSISGDITIR